MTRKSPRRVLIGTPSMDGKVEARYANSLAETRAICAHLQQTEVRQVILCYDAILPNLRNQILRVAVENVFDDLIMIDADEDWRPEWVPMLLAHKVDCVGGTYRKKQDAEVYEVTGDIDRLRAEGLIPVKGLGAGFLRLSRRAMLALWESSEPYRCRTEPPTRMVFEYKVVNGVHQGEDATLCAKLAALGITTYLDPSMTCGHTGSKHYKGDYAAWLANQASASPAAAVDAPSR